MEAEKSYKLGEGGLYTWMTDKELTETLNKDILSVPHALGVSNHMGSAFTQDERSMQILISGVEKRKTSSSSTALPLQNRSVLILRQCTE